MALQKQILPIPMALGQDTKTDPKQVSIGKMLSTRNVSRKKPGEILKRTGTVKLGSTQSGEGFIDVLRDELVLSDTSNIKGYSENRADFVTRGQQPDVQFTTFDAISTSYSQSGPAMTVQAAGYLVLGWNDTQGGVWYSVIDSVSHTYLVNPTQLAASGEGIQVTSFGTNVVVTYWNGTNLVYQRIQDATPTSIGGAVTVSTSGRYFDCTVIGTSLYFASQNGSNVYYRSLSSSFVLSSETTDTSWNSGTSFIQPNQIGCFGDPSGNFWVSVIASSIGTGDYIWSYTVRGPTLTSVLSWTQYDLITSNADFTQVNFPLSGYYDGANGVWLYTQPDQDLILHYVDAILPHDGTFDVARLQDNIIKKATYSIAGSGSTAVLKRSVSVASRPFTQSVLGVSTVFFVAAHDSELQSCYFLLDSSGNIYQRFADGVGGGLWQYSTLPQPIAISGAWSYPYLKNRTQGAADGKIVSGSGVSIVTARFGGYQDSLSLANALHVGGGYLGMYDGESVVEHGFHLYPEGVVVQPALLGGGMTGSGTAVSTYGYSATYEWTDATGQVHRSAPSPIQSVLLGNDQPKLSMVVSTTSGNATITANFSYQNGALLAYVGMKIIGAGIPADTYIIGYGASNTFVMSANATATATVQAEIVPVLHDLATGSIGSTTISYEMLKFLGVAGWVDGDSPSTYKLSQLYPTLPSVGEIYIAGVEQNYTAVGVDSATGKTTLTLNTPISPGSYSATLSSSGLGTTTSGNATITGFIPGFTALLVVGQQVFPSANFADAKLTVLSKTSTTVTLSANASGSGGITLFIGLDPTPNLTKGQTLTAGAVTYTIASDPVSSGSGGTFTTTQAISVALDRANVFFQAVSAARILLPTLRMTRKMGNQAPRIVVYRTAANGTILYQATPVDAPVINNPAVDYLYWIDDVNDTILIGNTQIYTTGGQLENIVAPPSNTFGKFKNRIFLIPYESPNDVWFSKTVISGYPVEFSDFLVARLEQTGGPAVKPFQLDDKIIFFKQTAIFFTAGDGPSDNGLNNDFLYPQIVSSDVGCIDPESVVITPVGLLFKSLKGIYLLDRSLSVSYVGADVEAYNASTVLSAELDEKVNQVRFSLSTGEVLIYDYYVQQWDVNSGVASMGLTNYQRVPVYFSQSGVVLKETAGTYTDNGVVIPISLKSSWLSLGQLQGYQRIYRILILGEYKSPHTLTIYVRRDFNDTIVQTVVIPVLTDPGTYQFQVSLKIQKCEAVQFEIVESQVPTYGEGFSLSAISVELGIKGGLNQMKAGVRYG